jgi:hypothetical protein
MEPSVLMISRALILISGESFQPAGGTVNLNSKVPILPESVSTSPLWAKLAAAKIEKLARTASKNLKYLKHATISILFPINLTKQ